MADNEARRWSRIAEQVRAGELYLDNEAVARNCLLACAQRIADLESMLRLADRTMNVSGFGDFDMAGKLQGKFASQGTDIDSVIREDMEVVEDMQEVMRLSLSRVLGVDVDNAGNIRGLAD
ncbi:hypothetical protein [Nocardia sp. CNY236]|uniref:hypothetical protein n=1 Tax=Nocardia sp. CNY236 TaxID=1169152 RepID=UPI000490BC76|nr:hypothetical protein [Nocardia sp. CNY236]